MTKPENIEAGDLVTVIAIDDVPDSAYAVGMVGTFDMEWVKDGKTLFTVLFGEEDFVYASEISLYKKG